MNGWGLDRARLRGSVFFPWFMSAFYSDGWPLSVPACVHFRCDFVTFVHGDDFLVNTHCHLRG